MTRAILLAFAVLFSGSALNAQRPTVSTSPPDRARLQQVLDAWATREPARAAVFYAKDAGLAFYDMAPRKYDGFAAYEKGVAEADKAFKSVVFRLGDDAVVHRSGDIAWSTADSGDSDHLFRCEPTIRSGRSRPPVPDHADQPSERSDAGGFDGREAAGVNAGGLYFIEPPHSRVSTQVVSAEELHHAIPHQE